MNNRACGGYGGKPFYRGKAVSVGTELYAGTGYTGIEEPERTQNLTLVFFEIHGEYHHSRVGIHVFRFETI